MKKVNVNDLVIGQQYYVSVGFWTFNNVIYCGMVGGSGKRKQPLFTCGSSVEARYTSINFTCPKSRLKAYTMK